MRIFEARYLDMVSKCLRNNSLFGVVTVVPEVEGDEDGTVPFARVGTSMKIVDADVETLGLIMIRCVGQYRFSVDTVAQQKDGLIIGEVEDVANDLSLTIPENLKTTSKSLQKLIESFAEQQLSEEQIPILQPYKFEDCAWVANRWLELIDMPLVQKQRLMQLDSPLLRLELIQDILVSNKPNDRN